MSFVQTLVQRLIRSLGFKRKLANLFQLLSGIASSIPELIQFVPVLQGIASWLGLVAIAHAVKAGTFNLDIHSVASFFSALLLAAGHVPALAPYTSVIAALAAILSALSTASFLGARSLELID